ncbi:MAG: SET domain-containing protein-lysine N-methyltransferase [Candidatus Aenigmarchaeota archaeon]|nr:SET domain-containing protein-lysine N-methyltransferase [Candidatus Aenigmarchaeota archaeon]
MQLIRDIKDLIVSETRNGKGLFSNKNFFKEDVVLLIEGELLRSEELNLKGKKFINNAFRFDEEFYLSPNGRLGDFLNHSCNPNCGIRIVDGSMFLVALMDIPKGSEIVMDYSTIIADDDIWKMRCNCGSGNCRKSIGRFSNLPCDIKEIYENSDIVPKYIKSSSE